MLCVHYVLCGRRRLTCTWACSYRSPPSVVARRWERCGGWPRWPSGSRVRPWLPQREKTRLTQWFSESLSSRSGSYFRPGKLFLGRNSSGLLFFCCILATKRKGISGSAWLIRITIRKCCRSWSIRLAPLREDAASLPVSGTSADAQKHRCASSIVCLRSLKPSERGHLIHLYWSSFVCWQNINLSLMSERSTSSNWQ